MRALHFDTLRHLVVQRLYENCLKIYILQKILLSLYLCVLQNLSTHLFYMAFRLDLFRCRGVFCLLWFYYIKNLGIEKARTPEGGRADVKLKAGSLVPLGMSENGEILRVAFELSGCGAGETGGTCVWHGSGMVGGLTQTNVYKELSASSLLTPVLLSSTFIMTLPNIIVNTLRPKIVDNFFHTTKIHKVKYYRNTHASNPSHIDASPL